MQLYKIRSGNISVLKNKGYLICVGISLGNKWFTPENILSLIQWSLKNSLGNVVVCPADDIHAINIQVRRRVSTVKAQEIAQKMSKELMDKVKQMVEAKLSFEEGSRVVYANWSDLQTEDYRDKVRFMYDLYENNLDFKREIVSLVEGHTSQEERNYRPEDLDKFATYLLEEFPEVAGIVPIKGVFCDAYVYPRDGEMTQFVEEIQKGKKFPEIKEFIIGSKPKTFLEVR